jgi:hypothetical protein
MSDSSEFFNMVSDAIGVVKKNKQANGGILLGEDKKNLEEMSDDLGQRIAALKKAKSDIDTFVGDGDGLYS